MPKMIGSLSAHPDPAVIGAALLVCILACATTALLFGRMQLAERRDERRMALLWQAMVGLVLGGGAWTTHFIAMLGYDPGLPTGFAIAPTLASLAVPVVAATAGAGLCRAEGDRRRHLAGGAWAGGGIGAMHYLGMAGLRIQASLRYDALLVAASLLTGMALAMAAFRLAARGDRRGRMAAAALLVAAIGVVHAGGMMALELLPDGSLPVPDAVGDHRWLTLLLASGGAFALLSGLSTLLLLEAWEAARRQVEEADRLRGLAEATFEGLAICDGPVIMTVNPQLAQLLGRRQPEVAGTALAQALDPGPDTSLADLLARAERGPVVASLAAADGEVVPVELRMRPLQTSAGPRTVLAVHDLRERLASEARIRHLALHDPLTELGNRAMLRDRLAEEVALARALGRSLAVHCLDFDGFKAVNDLHGHASGDDLLRQAALRLRAEMRETDFAARLGGDEFVVVQVGADRSGAGRLAERLTATLARPFDLIEGQQASISGSVGVALFPADGEAPETLLGRADMALYQVKERGRNGYAFYHDGMEAETRSRRRLEQDLRHAERHGQLELAYQPQAEVATGRVIGFEVLLRWHHPEHGPVPPDVFIPLAEATGAIVPIGTWVLRRACAEAAGWREPLGIAVNVSPVQLQRPGLVETVRATLEATGLDPSRLELEVTEGVLVRDGERALVVLNEVKALGVTVAMDDFGTGYSSLSTLRAFPFDRIKVDRSFVRDLGTSAEAAAIVRAVVGLGRGLGMPVIAEGVETAAQRDVLAANRCGVMQGYLVGQPGPIESFEALTSGSAGRDGAAGADRRGAEPPEGVDLRVATRL
ncbi:bifunctional diguanylate cyclase/phosphodiesterase [Roseicella aquatilis]|nr:EAL domain-containing protein [Roseicella aquatilis]